jgi:hypothetical protein
MTALLFKWDGEAMTPARPRQADAEFVVGESYLLDRVEQRSSASHAHFFACVNEAWRNLPEDQAERFPTAERLRKYALIMTGYRDERTIVASSTAEALRLAAFIRPMDEFAVVIVRGAVVAVMTAKSQSMRAMKKKAFSESKQAVLDYLASMIKVDRATLEREAGRAA